MKTKLFKILTAIAVLAFVALDADAQDQVFHKGDRDLNVGVGFGTPWSSNGVNTILPAISATYDLGLRDDWGPGVFGVGGYVGTAIYSDESVSTGTNLDYGYRYSIFTLAARATYHYTFVENLDTYGGAILGFSTSKAKSYGDWPAPEPSTSSNVNMVFEIFVGAKYYFSESIAAYTELATGAKIPIFTIGVAFKF